LRHHKLLPSESALVDPLALLVVVGNVVIPAFRLRGWLRHVAVQLVPGTEGFLLRNNRQGLPPHSSARSSGDRATDTIPNAAAYTSPDSTCHTLGASRPIQLRCRRREHVGSGQERVVLPYSPSRLPTDRAPTAAHHAHRDFAAEASRSLQLQ